MISKKIALLACTALIGTSCINYASAASFDFTVTTNDRSDTSDTIIY